MEPLGSARLLRRDYCRRDFAPGWGNKGLVPKSSLKEASHSLRCLAPNSSLCSARGIANWAAQAVCVLARDAHTSLATLWPVAVGT